MAHKSYGIACLAAELSVVDERLQSLFNAMDMPRTNRAARVVARARDGLAPVLRWRRPLMPTEEDITMDIS